MAEEFENIKENVEAKAEELKAKAGEAYSKAKEKAGEAYEKVKSEIDDFTAEIDPEDIEKNKIYAVLAYIGILVFIPIFFAKESKFAQFHANQGLVLFLIRIIVTTAASIIFKNWIVAIFGVICLVFAVMGIVNAIQGKAKELPVIGNFKILK